MQSQVKFNGVPEKVPEKVWEASVQPVRFNGVPEKVSEKVPEKVLEKVLEKVPEKVPGGFGAEPGQVQQGSGQGSREGQGGFGAEPGEVQQGSGKKFRRRFQEALVQSQVRFNGVRRRLQSRSRRSSWESLVQGQVRTGFPALGFAARSRLQKNF